MFMTKSFDFSREAVSALAQADAVRALAEDVGGGDLTAGLIDPAQRAEAHVLAREAAVICSRWRTLRGRSGGARIARPGAGAADG
jgi:nicotinate-nucleotide pyrophosphorylase (carboxylating)